MRGNISMLETSKNRKARSTSIFDVDGVPPLKKALPHHYNIY